MSWKGTFNIWQNRDFGKLYAAFNNQKLYFINDLQLFLSHRPIIGNTTLYLYCAPQEGNWIDELNSLAKKLNVLRIWIYSLDPLQSLNKFFKEEFFTIVVNLADDKEVLWKKVGDKTRNMIRKGRKMGVEVKLAEKEEEFNQWWEIYFNLAQTKKFDSQNLHLVKELFQKKELSKLFLSIKDNKIIGGSFFLTDKYPMYWLGGFDRKFRNYAPGHLTIWEVVIFLKEKGYRLLDLGGVSLVESKTGPDLFKKSFRGELNKGHIYEIPINKFKYQILKFISKI